MNKCKYIGKASQILLATCISFYAMAQKGMPAKQIVSAAVTTHYPQHEDFSAGMLSRLKVALGYTVKIAAMGLGKPRMMLVNPDGSIYVTRRDQGDVLLLTDKDKDGQFDD